MGNWDESIYGGDDALKWREDIYELCKIKEYGNNDKLKSIPKKNLTKNMSKVIDLINDETKEGKRNVGFQVLGAIAMHSGYDFQNEPSLKKTIISALDNDVWAKENGIRKNACKNFKKIIKDYDNKTPFNIMTINIFQDIEDEDEESIVKEFKEIFSLLNGRIKKLRNNIEEKSGNKDFDEGFETAAQEEINFLTDYKELVARQEMMGVLLERIQDGSISSSGGDSNEPMAKSSGSATDAGRADTTPG
jgi:hypothetical protein